MRALRETNGGLFFLPSAVCRLPSAVCHWLSVSRGGGKRRRAIDRPPDLLGRAGDVEVGDAPWLECVDDRVGDGWRRADSGGLSDSLRAERVDRRRRGGVVRLECGKSSGS